MLEPVIGGRTFDVSLTAAQRDRYGVAPTVRVLLRVGLAIVVVRLMLFAVDLNADRNRVDVFLHGFNILCSLAFVALIVWQSHRRRVAAHVSLRVTGDGFSGTVDGKQQTIGWCKIEQACDAGDAIVITRRKSAGAFAIPETQMEDAAAFWAMLEDQLIAKRGLIRTSAPRMLILNSAYP